MKQMMPLIALLPIIASLGWSGETKAQTPGAMPASANRTQAGDAEGWVGQIFLPKLGHTFYTEDRSKESFRRPPFPYEIEHIDGDWCEIRSYWIRKQDLVRIIEAPSYFSEKLRSGTQDRYSCYQRRALAWTLLGEHKLAITDYTQAIDLTKEPQHLYHMYEGRAESYYALHDAQQALADLRSAAHAYPHFDAQSQIAWILVTCPDAKVRNGKEAFELLRTEIMTKPKQQTPVIALAATYAEAGDFQRALEYQKKAIDLIRGKEPSRHQRVQLKAAEEKLSLYQSNKPYVDEEWGLDARPYFVTVKPFSARILGVSA